MVKRIYEKIIHTEPVVYLDLFKAIVLLGGATGFFVIDDSRYQAISVALGLLLPTLLTWLTRSSVYSQQTVGLIKEAYNAKVEAARSPTVFKASPTITN